MDAAFWRGRRVLITGHTGFKGSWLSSWLRLLGSSVAGYALEPDTTPSLFNTLQLADTMDHVIADVRDADRLAAEVKRFAPEIVFHMAAQALVRRSYREPVDTYATNVMGTAHLLEAVRHCPSVRVVVVVTTDKVYENQEWERGYHEEDRLGGHDPYSSSKACVELLTAAWRRSFFTVGDVPSVAVVSARAGNVIGGGDWSEDRIVPDGVRAFSQGQSLRVRNRLSTRPWHHVLEPLSGYLCLARAVYDEPTLIDAVNFGPREDDVVPVGQLVQVLAELWGDGATVDFDPDPAGPHEAGLLKLDCHLAERSLGWKPRTDLRTCLRWTVEWHRQHLVDPDPKSMRLVTEQQIRAFSERD